jgi:hypothetical protein
MIEREISALKCKHDFIQLSILALEFEYNQELAICFVVWLYNYNKIIMMIWACRESKAILSIIKDMKNFQNRKKERNLLKLILMRY